MSKGVLLAIMAIVVGIASLGIALKMHADDVAKLGANRIAAARSSADDAERLDERYRNDALSFAG